MSHLPRRKNVWAMVAAMALGALPALGGDVTLDGSAGPAKPIVGPNFVVGAADGRQVGNSLFHSFGKLSLGAAESLTFTGPSSTTIIVARVTGGTRSQIDGTIDSSAMPNAHLYLINPAGINFGATASLNVGQSFTASTADSIRLSDGTTVPSTGPLPVLSAAPVEAFGFAAPHQGRIEVQGARLFVRSGKSLAVVAGSVAVSDGALLRAANGRVQAVAAGSAGTAMVDATGAGAASLTAERSAGPLTIDATSELVVDGAGAGRIDLVGQSIEFRGRASSETGNVTTGARLDVTSLGDLSIDGGQFITASSTAATSGEIKVVAGGRLVMTHFGLISAGTSDVGNAGKITIQAGALEISGGSQILAQTGGSGSGGEISVDARSILIAGLAGVPTGIIADTTPGSTGAGGRIEVVHCDSLEIRPLGFISTTTNGQGAGGGIAIHADSILLDGGNDSAFTGISANTQSTDLSAGAGGNLKISGAAVIQVLRGAGIAANSQGAGKAGDIIVTGVGDIMIDGAETGIVARSRAAGLNAHGGTVRIAAENLVLQNGGSLETAADGGGEGGSIEVVLSGNLEARKGSITASAAKESGGNISVNAFSILLAQSVVSAEAGNNGGSIKFTAIDRVAVTDSAISASAAHDGGVIDFDPMYVILSNSDFTAHAEVGHGGFISIAATWYLPATNNFFDVTSGDGPTGTFTVTTQNPLITSPVAPLPVEVPRAEGLLMNSCEVKFRTSTTSFLAWPTYNPSALPPLWTPVQDLMQPLPDLDGPGASR